MRFEAKTLVNTADNDSVQDKFDNNSTNDSYSYTNNRYINHI